MQVAFNAYYLQVPRTGTGRYVSNLLAALGRVDGINDYLVFSPRDLLDRPATPDTFHWDTVPLGRLERTPEKVRKTVWELFVFPDAARQHGARLMHVPYFAPPARTYGIPTIVTVHDVINLRLPEYRATPAAQGYSQIVTRRARAAQAIITVSEHAKADIVELLGVPESCVRVIREAAAPRYRPVTDPRRLAEVRRAYGLGDEFVLNVGGMDARKNVKALVGAFAAVYHEYRNKDLQLFIAGDPDKLGSSPLFPDWRPLAAMFGVADQIVCQPVEEEDLPAMYSATSCFAFTSLYEGFGLTPLEAMACGAPVVCSDRTSLPEVVGRAGILVDPEDADALGAAMLRVLSSPEERADLGKRGVARSRLFTWEQVAAETSTLYAEVTGTLRD